MGAMLKISGRLAISSSENHSLLIHSAEKKVAIINTDLGHKHFSNKYILIDQKDELAQRVTVQ